MRGFPNPVAFEVGGKYGNAVTSSRTHLVHRGWRVTAVNGRRDFDSEGMSVRAALVEARRNARYTVAFRAGDFDLETTDIPGPTTPDVERPVVQERPSTVVDDCEEARKAAEEVTRRAADELLARKQTEDKLHREAEERRQEEQRVAQQEAEKQRETELVASRVAVEKRLESEVGLPPRAAAPDPQRSLLAVLAKPSAGLPSLADVTPAARKPNGPCDKCDGPHDADSCPHFKGGRDEHTDAWGKYSGKPGDPAHEQDGDTRSAPQVVREAQVISQPGDGSCLFHSLAYGLGGVIGASQLRAEIADYIAANADTKVAGNPLRDWVLWDSGAEVAAYAETMRTGSRWGGALELAVCAKAKAVEVHVYERGGGGFVCISVFQAEDSQPSSHACTSALRVVNVVYGGRVHYDALQVG